MGQNCYTSQESGSSPGGYVRRQFPIAQTLNFGPKETGTCLVNLLFLMNRMRVVKCPGRDSCKPGSDNGNSNYIRWFEQTPYLISFFDTTVGSNPYILCL